MLRFSVPIASSSNKLNLSAVWCVIKAQLEYKQVIIGSYLILSLSLCAFQEKLIDYTVKRIGNSPMLNHSLVLRGMEKLGPFKLLLLVCFHAGGSSMMNKRTVET